MELTCKKNRSQFSSAQLCSAQICSLFFFPLVLTAGQASR